MGFGHSRTITSTKQTYRNEWVDYYSPVKAANVLACGDGIVLYVGAHDYPGNLVVIDHGMGFLTWYMHMADISVSKGDTIKKGSVVGHTGETGFVAAAGADLSVMYTINGIPVCPYDLEDNSVVFYLEQ